MRNQYRFKLQAVLDYRERQLADVQQRAAQEEALRLQIVARIAECDEAIASSFQNQRAALTDHADLDGMQRFPHYVLRLREQRAEACRTLQAQERRVSAIQTELHQAMLRKKTLETLKDKDFARHRQELERAEAAFLEEIALNRHIRPRSGPRSGL